MSSLIATTTTKAAFVAAGLATAYTPPTIAWNPDAGMVDGARKIAFYLAAIWMIYILGQFVIPKRRQGMMGGRQGAGGYIAVGVVIIMLLDLTIVPKIINWILSAIWFIGRLFGLV